MRIEIDEEALAEAADARDYDVALGKGPGYHFLVALDRELNDKNQLPWNWR